MVFGIEDPQIILAYVLAIGVTIVCVVYGWLKWNKEEE
ncbi:MAG: symporter small accessory protein [Methanomassiliicoccales archaeon]